MNQTHVAQHEYNLLHCRGNVDLVVHTRSAVCDDACPGATVCFGWLTAAALTCSVSQQVHTGANAALAQSDLTGYCSCVSVCVCLTRPPRRVLVH